MSTIRDMIVKCPSCGKENKFPVYDSVNVSQEPDLREVILSQKAFNYKCDCGCNTHMFYPVLYHNMEKKFMIQFSHDGKIDEYESNFNQIKDNEASRGYRLRVVEKPFELTEKVLLMESKYDDRVVEVLKEMMLATNPDPQIAYLIFARDKEKGFVFICLDGNNSLVGMMPFRDELYDSVDNMFGSQAKEVNEYVIDQEWAREFLCEVKI